MADTNQVAAPKAPSSTKFIDTFESQPGTPGERTGHLFPTINRIRSGMTGDGPGPLKKLMVANRGVSSSTGIAPKARFPDLLSDP